MRKNQMIRAAVAMLTTILLLNGCGKKEEPAPLKDEQKTEETAGQKMEEKTTGAAFAETQGKGFIIDLPKGYTFDTNWHNWKSPDGTVAVWTVDASLFEKKENFEQAMESFHGKRKEAETGGYDTTMIENKDAEGVYSTRYFVNFNGKVEGYYGAGLTVSTSKSDYAPTCTQDILDMVASIRKAGGAADRKKIMEQMNLHFKPEQSAKMTDFMAYGLYAFEGDTGYGQLFDKNGKSVLARFDVEKDGDFAKVVNEKVLQDDTLASYVTLHGDNVYYIRNEDGIYRVPKTGGEPQKIIDDAAEYIQIVGDKLYYCSKGYHYMRADLDGKNRETVLDKEVYYPYFLTDEWMVYQDNGDQESLHLRHIPSEIDWKVTTGDTQSPILWGGDLYAAIKTDDSYHLAKIDINHPKIENEKVTFPIETGTQPIATTLRITYKGTVYNGTDTGYEIEHWKNVRNENPDAEEASIYQYTGPDYTIRQEFKGNKVKSTALSRVDTGGEQTVPFMK